MSKLFKVEALQPDGRVTRIDHKEDFDPLDPSARMYVNATQAALRVTPIDQDRNPIGETEIFVIGNRDRIADAMVKEGWTPTSFLENVEDDPEGTRYIMSLTRQGITKLRE